MRGSFQLLQGEEREARLGAHERIVSPALQLVKPDGKQPGMASLSRARCPLTGR